MGVYTSNTYNPLGSIQAALNNVNERNRIKNEYWNNKGQIWSNFANQMGQIGGRLTDALTSDYDRNDPNADAGWASYIISGDRGILDSYQNREAQKAQLLKQQEFQAAEAALARKFQEAEAEKNRQNARDIAGMNKEVAVSDKEIARTKAAAKDRLDAELAQAEYDDAINKVDIDKPETVLAAKKAAIKLNYANRNLPYYADDPQSFTVSTEFKEDAEPVKINKSVNKAIQTLDPIIAAPQKQWTDKQKEDYKNAFEIIKKYKPELITKYQIEETKKGASLEEKERAELKSLRTKRDNGENLSSRQRKRIKVLELKYK